MKRRLVVALAGLAIRFALPTYAQQKDLADPQTTQKILASKAFEEAHNNNDAAAIAAFYTRDAVFVTPGGPIIGRQAIEKWLADLYHWWHPKNFKIKVDGNAYHSIGTAGNDAAAIAAFYTRDAVFVQPGGPAITGRQAIEKWFADVYQWWHPKNSIHKVDGNAFHLIGTAGNEAWATGEWSETGQGKHGEPFTIKGYWCMIFVRESDDWKIRVASGNTTPDSVILIDNSFAPHPAATPSPTASPSTQ